MLMLVWCSAVNDWFEWANESKPLATGVLPTSLRGHLQGQGELSVAGDLSSWSRLPTSTSSVINS